MLAAVLANTPAAGTLAAGAPCLAVAVAAAHFAAALHEQPWVLAAIADAFEVPASGPAGAAARLALHFASLAAAALAAFAGFGESSWEAAAAP